MKRHIIFTIFILVASLQLSAQILVKSNGDTLRFNKTNPLRKITATIEISQGYNHVYLYLQNGASGGFHVSELDKLLFAESEETAIEAIKTNKEAVVYNAEANKVYVTNPKKDSSLMVYNIEGKCLRGVKGSELYLTGLPAGLYIVSYNNTLNVKILKK
jgi:hypothetical protein